MDTEEAGAAQFAGGGAAVAMVVDEGPNERGEEAAVAEGSATQQRSGTSDDEEEKEAGAAAAAATEDEDDSVTWAMKARCVDEDALMPENVRVGFWVIKTYRNIEGCPASAERTEISMDCRGTLPILNFSNIASSCKGRLQS